MCTYPITSSRGVASLQGGVFPESDHGSLHSPQHLFGHSINVCFVRRKEHRPYPEVLLFTVRVAPHRSLIQLPPLSNYNGDSCMHASQGTLYGRCLFRPVIRHHKQKELEEGSICSGVGFQRDKSPSWQRSVAAGDKRDGRNRTASSSTSRTERILEVGQRFKFSKPDILVIYFLQ